MSHNALYHISLFIRYRRANFGLFKPSLRQPQFCVFCWLDPQELDTFLTLIKIVLLVLCRVFIRHPRSENSAATTGLFPERALPYHNNFAFAACHQSNSR